MQIREYETSITAAIVPMYTYCTLKTAHMVNDRAGVTWVGSVRPEISAPQGENSSLEISFSTPQNKL